MCGIYGYVGEIKKGKKTKVLELMKALAVETETRGTDSTGFIAMTKKEFVLEKACVRAKEFVAKCKGLKRAIVKENATVFIGHNRWASIGDIRIENAHPFVSSKLALVHNGTFAGARDLAAKMKTKVNGTTDSEAMLMCLTKTGITKKMLSKFYDYSLVILNLKTGRVFFARDRFKPMFIFDLRKTLGIYVFASEVGICKKALEAINYKEVVNYNETVPYEIFSITKTEDIKTSGDYVSNYGRRGYPATSFML